MVAPPRGSVETTQSTSLDHLPVPPGLDSKPETGCVLEPFQDGVVANGLLKTEFRNETRLGEAWAKGMHAIEQCSRSHEAAMEDMFRKLEAFQAKQQVMAAENAQLRQTLALVSEQLSQLQTTQTAESWSCAAGLWPEASMGFGSFPELPTFPFPPFLSEPFPCQQEVEKSQGRPVSLADALEPTVTCPVGSKIELAKLLA